MTWNLRVRVDRYDERLIHVRGRWTGLGCVQDVSFECTKGVHAVSVGDLSRREMNAFSQAMEGVFVWDDGVAEPEVILSWSDMGEPSEERILLAVPARHHILPTGLTNRLQHRSHATSARDKGDERFTHRGATA